VADELVDRWHMSWEMSHESGGEVRAGIHREVAHVLADRASDAEMGQALERLERAVRSAASLLGDPDRSGTQSGNLFPALRRADVARQKGEAALAGGDRIVAIQHLLAGTDELQGITPENMARSLIVEGEASLRRGRGAGAPNGDELRRAERLLEGARTALQDDAPVLALRRSWYAVRLLEGRVAP
jgi:hypothetical protein